MIKCNWADNPIFIDFETQSACDLKAYGGRKYAEHPSTKILCCSILHDTRVTVWIPSSLNTRIPSLDLLSNRYPTYNFSVCTGSVLPEELGRLFTENTVAAHNLFGFDYHIWKRFGFPEPKGWIDTLYLARASGMPGSLDQLTEGGKDEAKLIVKKLWDVKEVNGEYIYPKVLPGQVEPLVRYAAVDVILMKEIWNKWNKLKVEADVIDSHIRVNQVGVKVDLELVKRIEQVSTYAQGQAENEIRKKLVKDIGEEEAAEFNIRSGKQMQEWLKSKGIKITAYDFASRKEKATLNRKAVEQCLANPYLMLDPDSGITAEKDIDPAVFDVLRLRGAALRITDAKMEKALIRTNDKGRALDLFSYHQAHTGRFSSSGIQVHNLPKSKKGVKLNELLRYYEKNLRNQSRGWLFERPSRAYRFIRRILPPNVTVDDGLSALIRPIFIPEPGKLFAIADYSAIEARGIAWISGQDDLLNQFALGIDPYVNFAAKVLRKEANEITDDERQIGKVAILGLGYSMGPDKFRLFCGIVGIDLTKLNVSAEEVVDLYRSTYTAIGGVYAGEIPMMGKKKIYRKHSIWDKLNQAATTAIEERVKVTEGNCNFYYEDNILKVELPSGRELWYNNCRIEDRIPMYCYTMGLEPRYKPTIVYDSPTGERSMYSGKWAENIVQAICRDIMAEAMVRLHRENFQIVLHCHDEVICEVDREEEIGRMVEVMSQVPVWASGFPIGVKGYCSPRYLKKPPKGFTEVEANDGRCK